MKDPSLPVVLMSHSVPAGSFRAAVSEIDRLEHLRAESVYFPVAD